MIELNCTNINKAMNISGQSVFHGGERGKKNFTEGNRRLPIFYNNGDTGATSPRPTSRFHSDNYGIFTRIVRFLKTSELSTSDVCPLKSLRIRSGAGENFAAWIAALILLEIHP